MNKEILLLWSPTGWEIEVQKRVNKQTAQWGYLRAERERLKQADDYPVLDSLAHAWDLLCADPDYLHLFDRDRLEWASDTPLSTLMFYTEMGIYPPPELLLGLLRSWEEYMDGGGKITLEEAFLGKVIRKAGNFASRHMTHLTRGMLIIEWDKEMKSGRTQVEAAENIRNRFGLKMDADSFVRMARTHPYGRLKRKIRSGINPSLGSQPLVGSSKRRS